MDQIISFDKSLQNRLEEYNQVFSELGPLPYSKLQEEWAYYLELTLDPNGWQALWKIPRLKCEELHIPFPSVVLIYVLNVIYKDLAALVRILAVQDDIHLPEKHYVPLSQLWPTRDQDKSIALNMNSTANALDMLRFFYIHLVMPWDEDDDSIDWKGSQLINRLRLHYDLKNGKIPKATAEHIHALLNEARRLNGKRHNLKSICQDLDSDIEINDGFPNKQVELLVEINVRLIEIQNEMHILENDMFRNVIIKRENAFMKTVEKTKDDPSIWLIFKEGITKEYIRFLEIVEGLYPSKSVTFAIDFMSKLESANVNDIILLSECQHKIHSNGAILEDFTIKGVGNRDSVQILSLADDVALDCVGDYLLIENVTIDCRKSQCAIVIRKGCVTLRNCKVIGNETSSTCQGILILGGAKVDLTNCEISGFSMGIVSNTGSSINISDCIIHNSGFGLKLYDNCQIFLKNTQIKNCKEYGIVIETDQTYPSDLIIGDFDILKMISHINYESIKGDNNNKGDVKIRKNSLRAKEDLFDNPDLDPTILESSDDEMETNLNGTVFEVPKVESN